MVVDEETVLDTWDKVDKAIKRVRTALPAQLSAADAELETARAEMEQVLRRYALRGSRRGERQGEPV